MGKVHRRGTAVAAKKANRRHGRNCRSAPMTPTGLALDFRRREIGKRNRWRAVVTWDPVDEDVAGRALNVESYQVQLRATDRSGDPVETTLQEEAKTANGGAFTVHSGSASTDGWYRELNASPDVIKKTLTSLTAGIATQVNFYARKQAAGSDPRLKFEVWNVTDGVTLGGKNEDITSYFGGSRLEVVRTFTPAVGKTYEARVSWTSGGGIALFSHITWHALGNAATWNQMVRDDESPLNAIFGAIPRPRSWYYAARVRTMNRHAGTRCWSAWTSWSTPTIPVTGATPGPPAPTGLVQTIDKVEGSRRKVWRVRTRWNEVPWWVPPDDDVREGADRYIVQLAVSNNGGSTTANVRTESIPADDADVGVLAKKDWLYRILGKRHYRSRVATVSEGKRGAFTSWTAWASPGGAPGPVTNLSWSRPTPAVLVAKWDPPTDPTDVDRYRVTVVKGASTVVDTGFTPGERWIYHIPKADRATAHKVRVKAVEEELVLDEDDVAPAGWDAPDESTQEESSPETNTEQWGTAEIEDDSITDDKRTAFKKCRVRTTTARTLGTANDVYIRFGTEDTDNLGAHDPAVTTDADGISPDSTYDLTLPYIGNYLITFRVEFVANNNGRRDTFLDIGPGTVERFVLAHEPDSGVALRGGSVWDVETTATDTIVRVGARQTSGGNLNINAGARLFILYLGK